MAFGVAVFHQDYPPGVDVCPNWDATAKACDCPKGEDGALTTPHPTYRFDPKMMGFQPGGAQTLAQWFGQQVQSALQREKALHALANLPDPTGVSIQ